jgi:hypothetical protein
LIAAVAGVAAFLGLSIEDLKRAVNDLRLMTVG